MAEAGSQNNRGQVVALSALRRRRGVSLGEKPLTQLWGGCQDVGPRGRPGCCSARATKGVRSGGQGALQ